MAKSKSTSAVKDKKTKKKGSGSTKIKNPTTRLGTVDKKPR